MSLPRLVTSALLFGIGTAFACGGDVSEPAEAADQAYAHRHTDLYCMHSVAMSNDPRVRAQGFTTGFTGLTLSNSSGPFSGPWSDVTYVWDAAWNAGVGRSVFGPGSVQKFLANDSLTTSADKLTRTFVQSVQSIASAGERQSSMPKEGELSITVHLSRAPLDALHERGSILATAELSGFYVADGARHVITDAIDCIADPNSSTALGFSEAHITP